MATSRCPIVRPQAGYFGAQGFTTDYHDWRGEGGCCKFCGVSRRDARTDVEMRPRLGWRGLEVDRAERELQAILAARPRRDGPPHTPDPERWASVTSLLARN